MTQETTLRVSGGSGSRQGVTCERKVVHVPASGGHHYGRKEIPLAGANIGTDGHLTNFLKKENRLHTPRLIFLSLLPTMQSG